MHFNEYYRYSNIPLSLHVLKILYLSPTLGLIFLDCRCDLESAVFYFLTRPLGLLFDSY